MARIVHDKLITQISTALMHGLHHHSSKLDLRSHLRSTQKTVAPFEFRTRLEMGMKLISNRRNWRFQSSIRDQQASSTNRHDTLESTAEASWVNVTERRPLPVCDRPENFVRPTRAGAVYQVIKLTSETRRGNSSTKFWSRDCLHPREWAILLAAAGSSHTSVHSCAPLPLSGAVDASSQRTYTHTHTHSTTVHYPERGEKQTILTASGGGVIGRSTDPRVTHGALRRPWRTKIAAWRRIPARARSRGICVAGGLRGGPRMPTSRGNFSLTFVCDAHLARNEEIEPVVFFSRARRRKLRSYRSLVSWSCELLLLNVRSAAAPSPSMDFTSANPAPSARSCSPRMTWLYEVLAQPNSGGRGGVVVRLLASHLGETGSIPGGVAAGFSHVGIVPDDAAGRRFSRRSFVSLTPSFQRCSIRTSLYPYRLFINSMLRTAPLQPIPESLCTFRG
ncbi:hypothetical protein PR048_019473 [Dryococelus australis]|uniref:Uncharacterized protein n=1 Tax=Dryococelus australis TaxID=614101 RepID=A0ABQ9H3P3_9NEOP|nr:hypothetical protein PR048_019473 [Dryococelus australis]